MGRLKNYGLWVSFFSLAGILVRVKYPNYLGVYTDFVSILLAGLVSAGILSDPTTRRRWYVDDKWSD